MKRLGARILTLLNVAPIRLHLKPVVHEGNSPELDDPWGVLPIVGSRIRGAWAVWGRSLLSRTGYPWSWAVLHVDECNGEEDGYPCHRRCALYTLTRRERPKRIFAEVDEFKRVTLEAAPARMPLSHSPVRRDKRKDLDPVVSFVVYQ